MAAPANKTIHDLNGAWKVNKDLSTTAETALALQGFSWVTRKSLSLVDTTLVVKQYVAPPSPTVMGSLASLPTHIEDRADSPVSPISPTSEVREAAVAGSTTTVSPLENSNPTTNNHHSAATAFPTTAGHHSPVQSTTSFPSPTCPSSPSNCVHVDMEQLPGSSRTSAMAGLFRNLGVHETQAQCLDGAWHGETDWVFGRVRRQSRLVSLADLAAGTLPGTADADGTYLLGVGLWEDTHVTTRAAGVGRSSRRGSRRDSRRRGSEIGGESKVSNRQGEGEGEGGGDGDVGKEQREDEDALDIAMDPMEAAEVDAEIDAAAHDKRLLYSYVDCIDQGWSTVQVWGFGLVNGIRRYVRLSVVRKNHISAPLKLVYDYAGCE